MSQTAINNQDQISTTAALEGIMRKHQQAWNTHDRAAFESLFTEDADFVNVLGQHTQGRSRIGQDFEQIHRTFMRNTAIQIESSAVRVIDSQTAVAHVRWSMTGMEKVPGWNVPDVRHGILLYVAVKREGEWKISVVQNTEELPLKLSD